MINSGYKRQTALASKYYLQNTGLGIQPAHKATVMIIQKSTEAVNL